MSTPLLHNTLQIRTTYTPTIAKFNFRQFIFNHFGSRFVFRLHKKQQQKTHQPTHQIKRSYNMNVDAFISVTGCWVFAFAGF